MENTWFCPLENCTLEMLDPKTDTRPINAARNTDSLEKQDYLLLRDVSSLPVSRSIEIFNLHIEITILIAFSFCSFFLRFIPNNIVLSNLEKDVIEFRINFSLIHFYTYVNQNRVSDFESRRLDDTILLDNYLILIVRIIRRIFDYDNSL